MELIQMTSVALEKPCIRSGDKLSDRKFIYLDNGATSWPKPDSVIDAMTEFYRNVGVAAGRGATGRSAESDRIIEQCRHEISRLIGARNGHVVFCFNGTDGLNLAIGGLLRDGDHVVITDTEHNSVLRPVHEFARNGEIEFDVVPSKEGLLDPLSFAAVVQPTTRLICVSQVSNVTGILQDVAAITKACRESNPDVLILVDAAQAVGHTVVDVGALECDMLVASGHKGMLGPLGTGFLYLSDRAANQVRATRFGGTGTDSLSMRQPQTLPQRFESGNLNVAGIAGLLKGVQYVGEQGIEKIADHERQLANRLVHSLQDSQNVEVYGNMAEDTVRTGVVSFNIAGQDPQTVAMILDNEFGIQVRSGLHCSPLMHQSLGTSSTGGTLRASFGVYNTLEDVGQLVTAITQLSGQLV